MEFWYPIEPGFYCPFGFSPACGIVGRAIIEAQTVEGQSPEKSADRTKVRTVPAKIQMKSFGGRSRIVTPRQLLSSCLQNNTSSANILEQVQMLDSDRCYASTSTACSCSYQPSVFHPSSERIVVVTFATPIQQSVHHGTAASWLVRPFSVADPLRWQCWELARHLYFPSLITSPMLPLSLVRRCSAPNARLGSTDTHDEHTRILKRLGCSFFRPRNVFF